MALTLAALAAVTGPGVLLLGVSVLAGAARGLFTLVGATIVTDLWGPERYAAINGTLTAPMAAAVAIGPFLGAWLAQAAGGYGSTSMVLAALAATGTLLFARGVGLASRAPGRAAPSAQRLGASEV